MAPRAPSPTPPPAPLVGRDEALETFDEVLDTVMEVGFRHLTLIGEPGAGKTRLLLELERAAAERGMVTLCGRSAEFEQETPFGPLIDALDDHVDDTGLDLDEATRGLLAPVFPALSASAQSGHDDLSGLARHHLHRAMRRLLEAMAHPPGLVLSLDDVHWADDSTLDVLDYLVRHPPRGPLLIAMSYRPQQARSRLVTITDGRYGQRVPVRPLTEEEADRLITSGISRARRRELFRASGGNPFYLEALAHMDGPPDSWRSPADVDAPTELPLAVRAALQSEFMGLPGPTLTVARAGAVAADEFGADLAAAAAGVAEPEALDALDDLVARDVLRAAAPGRFRFRHPLVRRAAYESAGAGWRIAVHARLADYLNELGAPATMRARHVEHSARRGDEDAVTTLLEAAASVATHAPTAAAHWLRAALDLLPATADRHALRVELLFHLVFVQAISGQAAEGTETAQSLLRELGPEDDLRRAKAIQLCGVMHRQLGRHEHARALVRTELERLPDPGNPAAVLLRLREAADLLQQLEVERAQEALDRIPGSPGPDWMPGLTVAIGAMRPMAAYGLHRTADAIRHLDAAGSLVDKAPDDHLIEFLDAFAWLCWTEIHMGRYDDALRHLDRLSTITRVTGQSYILGYVLAGQARVFTLQGRLDDAAAVADEAAEVSRLMRSGEVLCYALIQQCVQASLAGDHDRALALGAEAAVQEPGAGEWWGSMALFVHASALIAAGRPGEGAKAICDAWDGGTLLLDPGNRLACAERMAYAQAAQGRTDEAALWADRAAELAQPSLEAEAGFVRLARAHALRRDDPVEAAGFAAEAAELFRQTGRRPDTGQAELTAGQAYSAAGRRDSARRRLQAAREIFDDCGMRSASAQVAREQRRLGVYVPSASSRGGGDHGLSRRELDVAALVIAGDSNQQIAEKLFISIRTVETHMSHIFAKLGVSSRVGVATALVEPDT